MQGFLPQTAGYYSQLSLDCVSLGRENQRFHQISQNGAKNCSSEVSAHSKRAHQHWKSQTSSLLGSQAALLNQTTPRRGPPSTGLPSLTNGIRGSHTLNSHGQRGPEPPTERNAALHSRHREKGCFLWEQEMAVCRPIFVRAFFSPNTHQSSS